MNVFRSLGRVFVGLGKTVLRALQFAESKGLTEDLLDLAVGYVITAQVRFSDNRDRCAWAVQQLTMRGIPESVARLTVELAVQEWKRRLMVA